MLYDAASLAAGGVRIHLLDSERHVLKGREPGHQARCLEDDPTVGTRGGDLPPVEMLAQNPGLGKFVRDEFQNGSSQSLGRIMVAVLNIGVIGFFLDRVMLTLQQLFPFGTEVR